MFNTILYKYGIPLLLVATCCGLAYWYFDYSQEKIQKLTKYNAQLVLELSNAKAEVRSLEADAKRNAEAYTSLVQSTAAAEKALNKYLAIFKEHDLTKLSFYKPGLIETRANNATKEVIKGLVNETTITSSSN